jgi:hypothetical protein
MKLLLPAVCAALAAASCDGTSSAFRLPTAPDTTLSSLQPVPGVPPTFAPTSGLFYVPGSGQTISPGQPIVESVTLQGASCFPNWDASATCRTYEFVAPEDGDLAVTVSGTTAGRGDVIDLFVVEANGAGVVAYEGERREQATMAVKSGKSYGILVMTYPYALPIDFEVFAEFRAK